jgi:hypothetical protein
MGWLTNPIGYIKTRQQMNHQSGNSVNQLGRRDDLSYDPDAL